MSGIAPPRLYTPFTLLDGDYSAAQHYSTPPHHPFVGVPLNHTPISTYDYFLLTCPRPSFLPRAQTTSGLPLRSSHGLNLLTELSNAELVREIINDVDIWMWITLKNLRHLYETDT